MKIYAARREYNKEKKIHQFLGRDLWVKILEEGDPQYVRFISLDGDDSVIVNILSANIIDNAIEHPSDYSINRLRKELSRTQMEFSLFIDWIGFMPEIDVYSTQELYELAGITDGEIHSLSDVVGKDLWVKCRLDHTDNPFVALVKITEMNDYWLKILPIDTTTFQSRREEPTYAQEYLEDLFSRNAVPITIHSSEISVIPPMSYFTTEEIRRRLNI